MQVNTLGNVLVFPSFTSSTLSRKIASKFAYVDEKEELAGCCLFKITIPKGFPALYIEGLNEKEVLLPPCTSFVVTNIENNGNFIALKLLEHQPIYTNMTDFINDFTIWLTLDQCLDYKLPFEIKKKYENEIENYRCRLVGSVVL